MRTFAHKTKVNQRTNASAKSTNHGLPIIERSQHAQLQRATGNQAVQPLLQYKAEESEANSATKWSTIPPAVYQTLGSPGRSLDPDTRSFMESGFGHDFSRVRVHTDSQAAESARAINARAYTVGNDIVLSEEAESFAGKRLLAHELAHVVQQTSGVNAGASAAICSPNHSVEAEANRAAESIMAGSAFHPTMRTGLAVHRNDAPPPPPSLSGLTATREAFNNAGAPDPDNCAASQPAALGVDGPRIGQNGMEMIFRINGEYPPGTAFEITRTKASGVWQEDGGVWTRLGGWPAGTSDDHHDADECHTPVGGRIFVVDTPGLRGSLNPTGVTLPNASPVSATATAVVWKLNFAEWVIARNRRLGIGWQGISRPTFHRWHSIFSVENVAGVWTRVDTPSGDHNEIELGSTTTTGATP